MTKLRTLVLGAALIGTLALPTAASARKNPYTAVGVCGAGYKVIDRAKLKSDGGTLLSELVLTYSSATGKNCLVNLKRYRVGLTSPKLYDWLYVSLAARPLSQATVAGDSGDFKFFAGPVYVPARGHCVQWVGGATLSMPANYVPRGQMNSAYKSPWEHCS